MIEASVLICYVLGVVLCIALGLFIYCSLVISSEYEKYDCCYLEDEDEN